MGQGWGRGRPGCGGRHHTLDHCNSRPVFVTVSAAARLRSGRRPGQALPRRSSWAADGRLLSCWRETASSGVPPDCKGHSPVLGNPPPPHDLIGPHSPAKAHWQPPSQGARIALGGEDTLQSPAGGDGGQATRGHSAWAGAAPRRSRQHGLSAEGEAAGRASWRGGSGENRACAAAGPSRGGGADQRGVSLARGMRAAGSRGQSHVLIPGSVLGQAVAEGAPEAFQTVASRWRGAWWWPSTCSCFSGK